MKTMTPMRTSLRKCRSSNGSSNVDRGTLLRKVCIIIVIVIIIVIIWITRIRRRRIKI